MFKKVYLYVFIVLVISLLCTGIAAKHYKNKYDRLVEQHRFELAIARNRADILSDTITRAREEVGAIRESLGKQRTSVSELRELIREVRTRYEKMEELLNSSLRCYDFDDRDFNGDFNNAKCEVEDNKCTVFTE